MLHSLTTTSNLLSLARAPLAFFLLFEHSFLRIFIIVLAMISDGLDGYFARRYKEESRFGAILDPLMDRFFVLFALMVLLFEGKLFFWQLLLMLARDFVLFICGCIFLLSKTFKEVPVQATFWGKMTTCLQFCILMFIAMGFSLSDYFFGFFLLFAFMLFKEIQQILKTQLKTSLFS